METKRRKGFYALRGKAKGGAAAQKRPSSVTGAPLGFLMKMAFGPFKVAIFFKPVGMNIPVDPLRFSRPSPLKSGISLL